MSTFSPGINTKRTINTEKAVNVILAVFLILAIGCSKFWSPSNKEAEELVEKYYVTFEWGKKVNAEILHRGDYIEEYKCYPVEFIVTDLETGKSAEKTFFFFKNEFNEIEISDVKFNSLGLSLKKVRH
jgi:hypothetical protein